MPFDRLRKRTSAVLLALILCSALPASAQQKTQGPTAKRVVCWTDAAGQRACGDSVPPQFADREKKVLDGAGRTVKVIPGALTPEQRAAREAQDKADAAARRAAEQQAAYDRALLDTYASPEELVALRNDRLATIDTSLELTESAASRDAVSLAELRARLPAPGGKPAPQRLLNNVQKFEAALADHQRAVADLRRSRESVCNTFARDIRRYQELKHGSVGFDSPCPAQGSLTARGNHVDLNGARGFFDRYLQLEREFDPALLALYDGDARILTGKGAKPGARPMDQHRKDMEKTLSEAREKMDAYTYENLKVETEGEDRARISGLRTSAVSKVAVPFYVVLRPAGKDWRIVESWAETRP